MIFDGRATEAQVVATTWPPLPLLVSGTMTQPPSLGRERAVIVTGSSPS